MKTNCTRAGVCISHNHVRTNVNIRPRRRTLDNQPSGGTTKGKETAHGFSAPRGARLACVCPDRTHHRFILRPRVFRWRRGVFLHEPFRLRQISQRLLSGPLRRHVSFRAISRRQSMCHVFMLVRRPSVCDGRLYCRVCLCSMLGKLALQRGPYVRTRQCLFAPLALGVSLLNLSVRSWRSSWRSSPSA